MAVYINQVDDTVSAKLKGLKIFVMWRNGVVKLSGGFHHVQQLNAHTGDSDVYAVLNAYYTAA